ncbi:MAG: VCBS repeat-containing protein [Deltaproteobacteria bacterium]|nr:VCBS repeat-containing protein [Deltaproteobacteria bacterium]
MRNTGDSNRHDSTSRASHAFCTSFLATITSAAGLLAACGNSGSNGADAARTEGCGVRNPATGQVEHCAVTGTEVCVCGTGECATTDSSCESSYRFVEGVGRCVSTAEAATLIASQDEGDLCPGAGADADADADAGDDGDSETSALCGNGSVDPGEDCDGDGPGDCITSCGTGGTRNCVGCRWAPCTPPAETCNGEDDDCNTVCDDGFACCAGDFEECATPCGSAGLRECGDECAWGVCVLPAESCNRVDDDCDGVTDEVADAFACGDGCCNGTETYCSCPGDCTTVAPPPATPAPLWPWNGWLTGSYLVSSSLRPTFRWTASTSGGCGTTTYELQLDDSCPTDGFAACTFPSPAGMETGLTDTTWAPTSDLTVATAPPVGRRFFWHVRACDGAAGCSAWSTVRYVDVGRVHSDFNCDGRSDVAVSAIGYDGPDTTDIGAVYVYYGTATGVPTAFSVRCTDDPGQRSMGFGWSVAAGDFNADGCSDLAVGAPNFDQGSTDEGGIFLFYGDRLGLNESPTREFDNPRGTPGGHFGMSLAVAGDVNADGWSDLVVGSPSEPVGGNAGAGIIDVYFGADTLSIFPSARVSVTAPSPAAGAAFGQALAGGGDLLADGHSGFIVGAPNYPGATAEDGLAFLFRGTDLGVASVPWATLTCPAPCNGAHFGSAAALIGDMGYDSYPDFAIGAPTYDAGATDEGNVFVYSVGAGSPPTGPYLALDNPTNTPNAYFGSALAPTGWFGVPDTLGLIVGAPRQLGDGVAEGAVVLYAGTTSIALPVPLVYPAPDADADGGFGASVAGGLDLTGDGTADFVVGAPARDGSFAAVGKAFAYVTGVGPGPTVPAAPITLDSPAPYPSVQFGFALASTSY